MILNFKIFFVLSIVLIGNVPTLHAEDLLSLSEKLVITTKANDLENAKACVLALAKYDINSLSKELNNDTKKITFWVNVYNGMTNYILKGNPKLYDNRSDFFKAEQIDVGGKMFSLDFIEHGLLRRSKNKLSLGYFGKIKVSKFEKEHRVDKVDWRIHYALNCGAITCPPVVPYSVENFEKEMNQRTQNYLDKHCKWLENRSKLEVPVLFRWFQNDFGGKKGIYRILKQYNIIKDTEKPSLSYGDYDWTLFVE
jgi:hypothetical protein